MPSSCPAVRDTVNKLCNVCGLSVEPLPTVCSLPRIVPLSSLACPLPPNYLYVGYGSKSFPIKPSPWLNPYYRSPSLGLELFRKYVSLRPDFEYFMGHVARASVVVCDCTTAPCCCHARVLVDFLPCKTGQSSFVPCSTPMDFHELCAMEQSSCEETFDDDETQVLCDEVIDDMDLIRVNETIRAPAIGRQPCGPRIWNQLVAHVRSFQVLLFCEIFAGSAVLTECMRESGWECAFPIDILYHPDFDLLNSFFLAIVIGLILEGRFALIHVAPPCSSFSMAVNRFWEYAMRSPTQPLGFDNLPPHRALKVRMGNALCEVAMVHGNQGKHHDS